MTAALTAVRELMPPDPATLASFWTGQQAVDMGLADDLGSLDRVARDVVKAEDVVDYTQRANVAERLAKRFGAAVGEGAVKTLRMLPALRETHS